MPDIQTNSHSLTRRAIAVLAVTQIIGWGTTFFTAAVMAGPVTRDLGIDREMVFAGVAVMVGLGGALGPYAGRMIDRHGARLVMTVGSLFGVAATVILAASQGPISWLLGWIFAGAMMPTALASAAFAALAQISPQGARRAITTMTLFSGLSVTVFWPIAGWLDTSIGWRATYLVFAGLNLLVCLPLHYWLLPAATSTQATPGAAPLIDIGELPPERRRAAFFAFALATSSQGFIGWGLSLHLPHLFEALGVAAATALFITSLAGPAQILGRGIDMIADGRAHPLGLALLSVLVAPLAFLLLFGLGANVAIATAFILLLSASTGLMTVCRATVPLALYGRMGYGALLGRLSLPQNILFSIAPVLFAWLMTIGGPNAVLGLAFATTLIALGGTFWLMRVASVPLIVPRTS